MRGGSPGEPKVIGDEAGQPSETCAAAGRPSATPSTATMPIPARCAVLRRFNWPPCARRFPLGREDTPSACARKANNKLLFSFYAFGSQHQLLADAGLHRRMPGIRNDHKLGFGPGARQFIGAD